MTPYQAITTTVATAQEWIARDAIPMRYDVTNIEIAHLSGNREDDSHNDSNLNLDDLRDGPPIELLHQYIMRYELTHQDYCPIDVESIRWLIGQSSTLQFLSLERAEEGTLSPSSVDFNDTITLLETMRSAIRYGFRTFGDRELKDVPLFIQMKWMQNFQTPPEIMHHWFVVNRFLQNIQSLIPEHNYQANREKMDNWVDVLFSFWRYLLKEVNKHLFFRQFRSTQDIPRFQHSVRWTMFFFMFQTAGDPQEIVTLKQMIISNSLFKKGIRDFIKAVETALDDIKPVVFAPLNVSSDDVLNDEETVREITLILNEMDRDDSFQLWWSQLFINSRDYWRGALLDAQDGDVEYPRKDMLAASMLWDIEALVAYIQPTMFGKHHLHRVLLSLRNRIRRHIFRFILKESWF